MSGIIINNSLVKNIIVDGNIVNSIAMNNSQKNSSSVYSSNENTDSTQIVKDFYDSEGNFVQLRAIQTINKSNNITSDNTIRMFGRSSSAENFCYLGSLSVNNDFSIEQVQTLVDKLSGYANGGKTLLDINEYEPFLPSDFLDVLKIQSNSYELSDSGEHIDINDAKVINLECKNKIISKLRVYNLPYNDEELRNYEIVMEDGKPSKLISYDRVSEKEYEFDAIKTDDFTYSITVGAYEYTYDIRTESFTQSMVGEGTPKIYYAETQYFISLYDKEIEDNNKTNNTKGDIWSILYFPYLSNGIIHLFAFGTLKSVDRLLSDTSKDIGVSFDTIKEESSKFELYNYSDGDSSIASRAQGYKMPIVLDGNSFDETYSLDKDFSRYPFNNDTYDRTILGKDLYISLNGYYWTSLSMHYEGNNLVPEGVVPVDYIAKNKADNRSKVPYFLDSYKEGYYLYKVFNKNSEPIFSNNGDIILCGANNYTIKIINNIKFSNSGIGDSYLSYMYLISPYNLDDRMTVISDGYEVEYVGENIEISTENISSEFTIPYDTTAIVTNFKTHKYYKNGKTIDGDNEVPHDKDAKKCVSSVRYGNGESFGYLSLGAYVLGKYPTAKNFWLGYKDTDLTTEEYNLVTLKDNILYRILNGQLIEVNDSNKKYNFISTTEGEVTTTTVTVGEGEGVIEYTVTTDDNNIYTFKNDTFSKNSAKYLAIKNADSMLTRIANNSGFLPFPNTINGDNSSVIIENDNLKYLYNGDDSTFRTTENNSYVKNLQLPNNEIVYIMPYAFSGVESNGEIKYNRLKNIEVNTLTRVDIKNSEPEILDNSSLKDTIIWLGLESLAYTSLTSLDGLKNFKINASQRSFYGSHIKKIISSQFEDSKYSLGEIFENTPNLESVDGNELLLEEEKDNE